MKERGSLLHGWVIPSIVSVVLASMLSAAETNLLPNGDFEKGGPGGGPLGWELLQEGRTWVDIGGEHGHVLRVDIPREIARSEGYKYFSEKIPIDEWRTYRCRVDIRTNKPGIVVFLQGLTQFRGQEREIYEKQVKSEKRIEPNNQWGTLDFEFTPRPPSAVSNTVLEHRGIEIPHVQWLKVEFFVYGGDAGRVEFDNMKITEKPGGPSSAPASGPASAPAFRTLREQVQAERQGNAASRGAANATPTSGNRP
ncbi:MAG: hypothetical protein NTW86_32910 [Candidatus Sumerlaeota bacterium]|nr:hypothetical protein [Candidatus Sumerlaeota bacterium]